MHRPSKKVIAIQSLHNLLPFKPICHRIPKQISGTIHGSTAESVVAAPSAVAAFSAAAALQMVFARR